MEGFKREYIVNNQENEKRKESGELPILEYGNEIKEKIKNNSEIIVIGETGSGKTTELPIFLRESVGAEGKIAVTQPRQVAARSVSKYVARKEGTQIGDEIGYQVRFDDHTSEGTRINFMTDGILLRKIQSDPLLEEFAAVMVDEAHERSLNIDFALGLLKRIQKKRREANIKPLKIVVSSATLEKDKFVKYFSGAEKEEVPGRLHKIDTHYEKEKVTNYTKAAAEKVKYIIDSGKPGNILIFMPGKEEIENTIKEIGSLEIPNTIVLPMHAQVDEQDQDRIFEKSDKRKIIVSTNIAETSVTVPGVRHVVDSGLIKQTEFNPETGIEALALRQHAKSGCVQRGGRAGRTEDGECWRLYTEEEFNNRQEFQTPEMQRSNLAHVVLAMKKIGIEDIGSFEFIDPPSKESIDYAVDSLKALGAMDEKEKLTEIGEIMAELPLEPHISRMVIEAEKHQCVEEVATIAALLGSNKSPFMRPKDKENEAAAAHRKFKEGNSDFIALLKAYKGFSDSHFDNNWAKENFLNVGALYNTREIRYQLFAILKRNGIKANGKQDFNYSEDVEESIAAGLIGNLFKNEGKYSYNKVTGAGKGSDVYISPGSVCFDKTPDLMVASKVRKSPKGKNYAELCQSIKSEWLKEIAPQLLEEKTNGVFYDKEKDAVMEKINTSLKGDRNVILQETRAAKKEEAEKEFARTVAGGYLDLSFVKRNREILDEARNIWIRAEGKNVRKEFSYDELLEFYQKNLGGAASKKELEQMMAENKINAGLNIDNFVSPENKKNILADNPENLQIGEKAYKIKYESGYENNFIARTRILAQDVFSLKEMPKLPSGKILRLDLIMREEDSSERFFSSDLAELKKKAKEYILEKQWTDWRYSDKAFKEQELPNFNLLGEMPAIPEPLQYGVDPETQAPVLATAAVEKDYWGNRFFMRYFSDQKKAEEAQGKTLALMAEAKDKKIKEDEREKLLAPAKEKLKNLLPLFEKIKSEYSQYGLDYNKKDEMGNRFYSAQNILESDTKQAMEILNGIEGEIKIAVDYKEKADASYKKAEEAINQYYTKCPLCGKDMEHGERMECSNSEHGQKIIDFEDNGNPAVLSQIVTDKGEVIAQARCSAGTRRYNKGNVYILTGLSLEDEPRWKGEPFESLKFEDQGKILTAEQAKEKERLRQEEEMKREEEEAKREYEGAIKYAEEQVEKGVWGKGKFIIGAHPKTKQLQYELEMQKGEKTIKCIPNQFGKQPEEPVAYYFSYSKSLVNTPNFELVIVNLEYPYEAKENKNTQSGTEVDKKAEINEVKESFGNMVVMKGFFGNWKGQEGLQMYAVKETDGQWGAYVGEPDKLIPLKGYNSKKKGKTPEELMAFYNDPYGGYFKGEETGKSVKAAEVKKAEEPPLKNESKKEEKTSEKTEESSMADLVAKMNKGWK